jgi:hydrogenase-4 component B
LPETALTAALWAFLAVPLLAWLAARSKRLSWVPPACLAGGLLLGTWVGVRQLGQALPLHLDLWASAPFPAALEVDRLSGFFLALICLVSLPVTAYSWSYLARHYSERARQWIWALTSLFILSMALVAAAATVFVFLIAWEAMTLFSAALILLDGVSPERRHNLYIYLLMMHAGAAAVAAAFFAFLPSAGGLDFASLRAAGPALGPGARAAVFLLALIGFSMKAGIIPLHLWLPRAHPIAPSPVSALMSGVMLKTAVYGLVRFSFDFLGQGWAWQGYVVLGLGALSGLLGILYALGERDLKRLLAYSSVDNIGIIYLALGSALVFRAHHEPAWAAVGLTAALLHTLNHACFKSLLFLGAGALTDATHTLNLDEMGELFRRMPATGAAFLIGCASIAGMPLLNGFVGELLLFQCFLAGSGLDTSYPRLILPLMAGVLALIGGLAAACFVQAFSVAFLGRARSPAAEAAHEVPAPMRGGMAALALACLILGILPQPVLGPLFFLAQSLLPGALAPEPFLAVPRLLAWAGLAVLTLAVIVFAAAQFRQRTTATWACGLPGLTPRMQYTATSFSKPLRAVFIAVYNPDRKLEKRPLDQPYFPASMFYRSVRTTSFEKSLYRPMIDAVVGAATQLRRLQTGNIQYYLLYIFLTLVALLTVVGLQR